MVTGITFLIVLLIRIIPVVFIGIFISRGFIDTGHLDPLLYLGGAQTILKTGSNPFSFFPPINFLFIAAFLYIGNGNPLAPMAAIAIVGWLTVIGIYLLAKELWGEKIALLAAILSGVYPNLIFYGVSFYAETLAIFWIVFSFLLIMKYFRTNKGLYLNSAGILWGLASQTRGGLHYFSVFIVLVIVMQCTRPKSRAAVQSIAIFLMTVYITIFAISIMVAPIHGEASLNSKSGIGSMVHGANRITTSCSDYGDVQGNIFYDINNCKENWPKGSNLYSDELMKQDTVSILYEFLKFILQEPITYLKNSLLKLSCSFSPNQVILSFIKANFNTRHAFFSDTVCLGISLFYAFVICGGMWGMSLSKDPFRILFIFFIVFYCFLIFLTVGNSKLRLPLMPFFIIYCSYFLMQFKTGVWKKALANKWALIIILIFLTNSVYKYPEILLSPAEIQVRKIELCNQLGFPKTALCLLEKNKNYTFTDEQKKRLKVAEASAKQKLAALPEKN